MWYLKFKWLQWDSSPQPLSSSTNTQVFGQTDQMIVLLVLICTAHMTLCSYLVTYVSQSEPTLYICLNVRQFLPRRRYGIWSLSECNVTRTQNYIVHKPTLNHLAKLTKCLSWVVSAYLYGAIDCILLSCHIRVSQWIHTLYLPGCYRTTCLKQARYLKFNCFHRNSNPEGLSS